MAELERKQVALELKADGAARTIEGYAATFGGLDSYDDTILKGAFAASLAAKFRPQDGHVKIRVLWQHSWEIPIGKPSQLVEDDKGLFFKAELAKTRAADEALELIGQGIVEEMSIGYMTRAADYVADERSEYGYIRILREVDLYEISPVTFGADSNTSVAAKSARVAELARRGLTVAALRAAVQGEVKAGRMVSQKNLDRLKSALEALKEVIEAAEADASLDADKGAALAALAELKAMNATFHFSDLRAELARSF